MAQMQQMQPPRFGRVYVETNMQPPQRLTDVPESHYRLSGLSVGMMLPLYTTKFRQLNDTTPPPSLAITIHPSVSYSRISISHPNQERILMNPQFTLSSYYMFKRKSMFFVNLRTQLNEDEFTAKNPEPRYAFLTLYSRKVSGGFSYFGGAAYSYVFGEGRFFPLLGARVTLGKQSTINMVLPLQVTFRTQLSSRLRLSVYLRPQGGVNRFENRLTIADSTQKVLVFRRRGAQLGVALSYQLRNNLSIVIDPSLLVAQKIQFTNESGSQTYINHNLSRGFQLHLMIVWRPWQNSLRNQQYPDAKPEEDDSFLLGF